MLMKQFLRELDALLMQYAQDDTIYGYVISDNKLTVSPADTVCTKLIVDGAIRLFNEQHKTHMSFEQEDSSFIFIEKPKHVLNLIKRDAHTWQVYDHDKRIYTVYDNKEKRQLEVTHKGLSTYPAIITNTDCPAFSIVIKDTGCREVIEVFTEYDIVSWEHDE